MKTNQPKVSVITVVYNAASTLQTTINSIADQDYTNIEYIIIDGKSSDGTVSIINNNNSHISKWLSEPDHGIYDAMNKGVKIASGDFVIFMNAGDRFYSQSAISACMHDTEDSDIIYGDHWIIGSRRNDGHHKAQPTSKLQFGMICSHQSMFFRRKILLTNPFSLEYGTAGDYECICRIYKKGSVFKSLPGVIVSYYHAGGVSDTHRIKSIKNTYRAAIAHQTITSKSKFFFIKKTIESIAIETLQRILTKISSPKKNTNTNTQ